MIYAREGIVETQVFTEQVALSDWEIQITGKKGREVTTQTFPITILSVSNRRYYLTWSCPVLNQIEYDYEIKSGTQIIDKGILRYL